MKRFFKGFMLFLFLTITQNSYVYSDDMSVISDKPELYQVNTIEDIEKDIVKRLILGVLGKDALLLFLPSGTSEGVKDQVKSLSEADVYRISKPFNSSIISGTLIMIAAFFLVAIITMLFYIVWIYMESLLRTQDSGEFLGGKWNKIFTPLKVVIGFFLIFPLFGTSHAPFNSAGGPEGKLTPGAFSFAQVIILSAAGASSNNANVIYGEFIRTMPKSYPAIKMPNLFSKQNQMNDLIDFLICVKATHKKQETLTFGRYNGNDKSVFKASVIAGSCQFYGQVGYDESTVFELENNNFIRELLGNIDYRGLQKEVVQAAVSETFAKASLIADAIIKAESSRFLINTNLPVNVSNWRDYCPNIENALPFDANRDDIIEYTYYASNCLSKFFVEKLTKTSLSSDYIYGTDNYLRGNNIELCNHEISFSGNEKKLTYAKNKNEDYLFSPKFKLIKQCVNEVCSNKNIYECASAIHFAKSVQEKDEMARQGWMTAGANFYKVFSGADNIAAKSIVNKSTFTNSYLDVESGFKDLFDSNEKLLESFQVVINGTPPTDFDSGDFNGYVDRKSDTYIDIVTDNARSSSFLDGGKDGWFGIAKFQNCMESPMNISNGYLCGNVTEELHLFGSKLIALGIQVKTITLFMTNNKGRAKKDGGTVSKKAPSLVKQGINLLDFMAPKIIAGYLLDESFNTADSFSDIDPEIWQQYPEVVSFIGAAAVTGMIDNPSMSKTVLKVMNIFMGLCIFLGIIFGFFMPLLPFGLWLIAVSGWIVALFEALVLSQIWGVVLISPSADHSSDAARKSTIIIVSVLLKAPLLVIGLIIAWLLNNILLSELLSFTDISQALSLQSSDIIKGMIDQFIMLIIYFIVLYGLYNIIFSLIENFEKMTIDILFSGQSMSPFARKQRDSGWNNSLKSASSALTKG